MAERNRITDTNEPAIPMLNFNGLMLAVLADLPEGGQAHFQSGPIIVPGLRLAPGTMVMAIPAEVAAQLRPMLRQLEKTRGRELARAGIIAH